MTVARRSARRSFGAGLLVFLAALAFHAWYARHGDITPDEGWLLQSAARVARGEVPHRDFDSIYPPGGFLLFAAVDRLSGGSILAERLTWCLLRAAVALLVLTLARRLVTPGLAAAVVGLTVLVPGPWHKTFYSLVPLAALWLLCLWLERGRRRWLVLAGASAGIGFWLRQDAGITALAACLAVLALAVFGRWRAAHRSDRDSAAASESTRGGAPLGYRPGVVRGDGAGLLVGLVGGGFAGGLVGGWLALASRAGLDELWRQLVLRAFFGGGPSEGLLHQVLALRIEYLAQPAGTVVALLCWPLVLLPIAALGQVAARAARGRLDSRGALLGGVAVVALLGANQVFRVDVLIRLLQTGPVFYLLAFSLVASVAASARRSLARPADLLASRALRAAAVAMAIAFCAYVLFDSRNRVLPVEYTGSIALRWQRTDPIDFDGLPLRVSDQTRDGVVPLARLIRERGRPEDGLIVLGGRLAGLHSLTGLRSPARLVRFDRALASHGPRFVRRQILAPPPRFLAVDDLFLDRRPRFWRGLIDEGFRPLLRVGSFALYEPLVGRRPDRRRGEGRQPRE